MTLFLTSSPSGCPFEPGPDIPVLDTRNHFVANLRAVWPDHAVLGLAIAADPYAYEQNDEMCRVFAQSFANAHLPLTALIPCDARNASYGYGGCSRSTDICTADTGSCCGTCRYRQEHKKPHCRHILLCPLPHKASLCKGRR